jgi:hypothetical protein
MMKDGFWKKIVLPAVMVLGMCALALFAFGTFEDYERQVFGYNDAAGGSFSGTLDQGKYEGQGVLALPGGDRYEGFFRAGTAEAQGKYVSVNNWSYEGTFAEGIPSGEGTFTTAEGEVYSGKLNLGELTGEGSFKSKSGWSFTGTFQGGEIVSGKLTMPDSSSYEGAFADGLAHGAGVYIHMNAGKEDWRYEGAFAAGQRHGQGTLTTFDTSGKAISKESGNWANNVLK